jgi:NADH-quinone oxidoreductase subunit G
VVVAHASVLTDGLREHATVIFPAESYAEKEGTVVHPDGRLQRLRTAIKRPGEVRPGWQTLAEIARRVGNDARVLTAPIAFRQLVTEVPFYAALTLEDIGGHGVRWPAREEASAMPIGRPAIGGGQATAPAPPARPSAEAGLRLGRYRSIWAAPEVEVSPALKFAIARQQVELSPTDAERLGITAGDRVEIAQLDDSGAARNGEAGGRAGGKPERTRLRGLAHVRDGVPEGTAFLADALATDSANVLTEPLVEVRKA